MFSHVFYECISIFILILPFIEQDNLRQVTRALEDLVAVGALLIDVHGRSILLTAGHRALNALIDRIVEVDSTLGSTRNIRLIGLSRGQGNWLSVLHDYKFGGLPILGQTTFQGSLRDAISNSLDSAVQIK